MSGNWVVSGKIFQESPEKNLLPLIVGTIINYLQ